MKTKKSTIILTSIAAVCLAGLVVSQFVDWNVDSDKAGGNIGKSSRFSRKTADEGAGNMEELLKNDPEFKDGIVAAYLVMKTRAQQFNALVKMSADVAGDIPAFANVLQAMKDAQPMITNVCESMEAAGNDLNAALGGDAPKDLAQNTNNAALAYGILQKENSLADDFIDTADKYLKTAEGDDRLLLVRDQWVQYQQLTAALAQDADAAAVLEEKGYLLSPERSVAALNSFGELVQMSTLSCNALTGALGISAPILSSFVAGDQSEMTYAILHLRDQAEAIGHVESLSSAATVKNAEMAGSAATVKNAEIVSSAATVASAATVNSAATVRSVETLSNASLAAGLVVLSATGGLTSLQEAAAGVMNNIVTTGMQLAPLSLQMNNALSAAAGSGSEVLNLI